jgi:predicted chitinase
MADISKILGGSIKEKILGITSAKGFSKDGSSSLTKVIAKNFMALPGIARDLNVARQNIQTLVALEGGKPASSPDAFFLKEKEREKKLEVETAERKPKKTAGKALAKGLIMMGLAKLLKIVFASFSKVLLKYLAPAVILGTIFIAFKDAFVEWATGLFDAIKTKFDEFTSELGQWFTDSVAAIGDKIKDFVKPIVDTVSGFFSKVGDFFVGYFEIWRNVIMAPIITIKKVYDAFMGNINKIIDKLPNWLKKELGIETKKQKTSQTVGPLGPRAGEPDPLVEAAKKRQAERAEKKETERVKKLEKEKQYTGDDEIVRARLGLPPKTESMRREAEMAKTPPPVETAPPSAPIIVPGPMPSVKKEEAKAETKTAPSAPTPSVSKTPEKKTIPGAPSQEPLIKKISPEAGKKAMLDEMNRQNVSDPTTRAAIMAQAAKETGGFMYLSENLGYGASGLRKIFKRLKGASDEQLNAAVKGGAAAIGELVYGGSKDSPSYQFGVKNLGNTEPGDGAKFRGRGFFQLTGRANYKRAGALESPEKLINMDDAAKTAVDFALRYKGNFGDPVAFTKYVNGGTLGLKERIGYFEAFQNDPSITKIDASTTTVSGGNVAAASSGVASGQRQQAKPQTPVVVNAPTTNNLAVSKNQVASSKRNDVGSSLANAAA